MAEQLLGAVSRPFVIDGHELFMTASVGIAVYPDDGSHAGQLLRNADTAMHRGKEVGGNCTRLYDPGTNEQAHMHLACRSELHNALRRDELRVLLPAPDRPAHRPDRRRRGPCAVGAPVARSADAGRLRAARRRVRSRRRGRHVGDAPRVRGKPCNGISTGCLRSAWPPTSRAETSPTTASSGASRWCLQETGLAARPSRARDHREPRARASPKARSTSSASVRDLGPRFADRRLRHRLLRPRPDAALPGRPPEDRPHLRQPDHVGAGRRAARVGLHRDRAGRSASRSSPRASRPSSSRRSCARTGARRRRASSTAVPSPPDEVVALVRKPSLGLHVAGPGGDREG